MGRKAKAAQTLAPGMHAPDDLVSKLDRSIAGILPKKTLRPHWGHPLMRARVHPAINYDKVDVGPPTAARREVDVFFPSLREGDAPE